MEVHAADTTSFVSRFFSVASIVDCDDVPGCLNCHELTRHC